MSSSSKPRAPLPMNPSQTNPCPGYHQTNIDADHPLADDSLDQILTGDCLELLPRFPAESVDLVFADPPYNLQIDHALLRPDRSRVNGVDDAWDHFANLQKYDEFTCAWLTECRRVLKPNGTLWAIGTYHNIFRVGAILQELNFWILNDIIWIKANPMPNFRGMRFTNAHETLIWAQKERGRPYTFNHQAMKAFNDGAQMRSDWVIPVCKGRYRLKEGGIKLHTAQKPESLLYRVLLASTRPGDVVLDPFFGSGTTGVAAKRLGRHYIGIEKEEEYVRAAEERIRSTPEADPSSLATMPSPRMERRIPFGMLLEQHLLSPGDRLYWNADPQCCAQIQADGSIVYNESHGTIHHIARMIQPALGNGWLQWHYRDPQNGRLYPIDRLRNQLRQAIS